MVPIATGVDHVVQENGRVRKAVPNLIANLRVKIPNPA